MPSAMVVMVLKLVVVVAEVLLLLYLSPLQVHLQSLFSPSRAFLDEPLLFLHQTKKCEAADAGWRAMLLGWWRWQTALAQSIRRRQHPVPPPPHSPLHLSTNESRRREAAAAPPPNPSLSTSCSEVAAAWKTLCQPSCISSPAIPWWLPSISSSVHCGSRFCPL